MILHSRLSVTLAIEWPVTSAFSGLFGQRIASFVTYFNHSPRLAVAGNFVRPSNEVKFRSPHDERHPGRLDETGFGDLMSRPYIYLLYPRTLS